MAYLMGIDLGTSSLKTIIIDETGNVKAQSARAYQFATPCGRLCRARSAGMVGRLLRDGAGGHRGLRPRRLQRSRASAFQGRCTARCSWIKTFR